MRRDNSAAAALALGLMLMTLFGQCYGQLKVGYYNGKCKNANVEGVIYGVVASAFSKDPTLVAAMLRLLFHEAFVNGCDGGLLLDGRYTEKTAGPNQSVRGYELIDAAKAAVERICPGVVSCSDIIVICTRFTVLFAKGYWYDVETGRRDGRISRALDAKNTLPSSHVPVETAVKMFAAKNLTTEDFVLLMGGHTVGITQCGNVRPRLYNYKGVPGASDPSISPPFLQELQQRCPNGPGGSFVILDQVSPFHVDNGYYKSIVARKGVLQIDQDIASHPLTRAIVARFASNTWEFNYKFGRALNNLARYGVLTGTQGEIRRSCRSVNTY